MLATLFDIKHFAVHDGPGIRQTIFFKGCPLNCWWCHNPESQEKAPEQYIRTNTLEGRTFTKEATVGYQRTTDELFDIIQGDRIFFEESGGGVTFSGGEPLMQPGFLLEILNRCQENNIHTCIDTTGYASQKTIASIAEKTDLFLYDLKLIDDELHQKYTGVPVGQILKNLEWLDAHHGNVILRFPVIPGITDTKQNLSEIKSFIKSLKNITQLDLLPYHNIQHGKYERFNKKNKMGNIPPPSDEAMNRLKSGFESLGLNVGIGG
ncbi:MAG: glycyl-radical enzyme activating protein [Bacteroidales bacterium]|jgi:pyruvate formate lyase activating enzyme|nr:glycyl-radical enzyme activating protein [Bacteroidales bacterium]